MPSSSSSSSVIRRNEDILRYLCRAPPSVRQQLIAKLPKSVVDGFSEVAVNLFAGNVPLNAGQKRRIRRHKDRLRYLASRSTPLQKKRKLLQQKGGFLGALIPILGSVLGGLFGGR